MYMYASSQIYQSSVAYSPDAIQTSGGYFHLGRVFLMEGKIDIAASLHTRVTLTTNLILCTVSV